MTKFRKLPVEVEAFQFDGDLIHSNGAVYVPDWAWNAYEHEKLYYDSIKTGDPPCELFVKTLEGNMHVSIGDWIIKGVDNELYPCKPDIFSKTYESVEG